MRAGPSTNFEIVTRLDGGVVVTLLGLLDDGTWALIRVDDPASSEAGLSGWMALELMQVTGDMAGLPRYDSSGTLLETATPAAATQEVATPTVTAQAEIVTPTATLGIGPSRPVFGTPPPAQVVLPTPTATPAVTPVITLAPSPAPTLVETGPAPDRGRGIPVAADPAPGPQPGALVATVLGTNVPANPLLPIPVRASDGRTFQLALDVTRTGQVAVWSGLLGEGSGRWIPAGGELLWPGSRVYIEGPLTPGTTEIRAQSVQIAALPQQPRTVAGAVEAIGQARQKNSALALVGSRDDRSIFLLETTGSLAAIGANGQRAISVPGEAGGLIVPAPNAPSGINSFTLLGDNGNLLEIFAQPFYNIRGIAGDGFGSILWIETPQAELDQWQLWEYQIAEDQVRLLAQASLDVFGSQDDPILPSLVAPVVGAAGDWWYLIETARPQNQQTNTGFFQITIDRTGKTGEVRRLMTEGTYRAPLQVSPDGSRLAYLAYDPAQPSLTAGFVQPSNRLWIRPVGDNAFGNDTPVAGYATENRFEFLTPSLAWQDNQKIVLTRSRFAPAGIFALDTFGITEVDLAGDEPVAVSYLLRIGSAIKDTAVCQDDRRILMSVVDEAG
ncbi:MAG: hypothetical protein WBO46_05075, partial [Caldilineaceae bacterium]